jgi:hypothetical protein
MPAFYDSASRVGSERKECMELHSERREISFIGYIFRAEHAGMLEYRNPSPRVDRWLACSCS